MRTLETFTMRVSKYFGGDTRSNRKGQEKSSGNAKETQKTLLHCVAITQKDRRIKSLSS